MSLLCGAGCGGCRGERVCNDLVWINISEKEKDGEEEEEEGCKERERK